jgi:hypothetical protein
MPYAFGFGYDARLIIFLLKLSAGRPKLFGSSWFDREEAGAMVRELR